MKFLTSSGSWRNFWQVYWADKSPFISVSWAYNFILINILKRGILLPILKILFLNIKVNFCVNPLKTDKSAVLLIGKGGTWEWPFKKCIVKICPWTTSRWSGVKLPLWCLTKSFNKEVSSAQDKALEMSPGFWSSDRSLKIIINYILWYF